jgi:N-acyl-D-aspartate/D-glutamate deacylase
MIIRNGTIVDGSGGEPFRGDLAIEGDRIAAIGRVDGSGSQEIDAAGQIVTPGFIDVHTHYDGQAIWSERLNPSSAHGVTTVVVGNCGVGFAPCREKDRNLLIASMEGVEDIPEIVMVEGLTWEWESFPDFLDAIEKRPHDINVACYVPHSALRVYVMGDRGANREEATAEDIEKMVAIMRQAMEAGAVGLGTSSTTFHRRIDGVHIASYQTKLPELVAIAREIGRHGGIFQMVSPIAEDIDDQACREAFEFLQSIARDGQCAVTFTMAQADFAPTRLRTVMDWLEEANKEEGVVMKAQLFPRPVGMVLGLDISANPFLERPTYKKLAALPLAQKVAELRKPEVRAQILGEESGVPTLPLMNMARKFDQMYPLGENPNYEPDPNTSVEKLAKARGITPDELAYDLFLERDGHAMMMVAMANFTYGNLDELHSQLQRPEIMIGLGDGGAHYGLVCDSSYPTFMLGYWARDRKRGGFSIPEAVRMMSSVQADFMGFSDRGRLEVGRRADINIIDVDKVQMHAPSVLYDLPGGGRRVDQTADGYSYTIVGGKVIQQGGKPTGELPGKLLRANRVGELAEAAE